MKNDNDFGVQFYLNFEDEFSNLSADQQVHINVFMCFRLSTICEDLNLVNLEKLHEIEMLIVDQTSKLTKSISELASNQAEQEALNSPNSPDQALLIGYWSIVSYFFKFYLTQDQTYTKYIFIAYTNAIDEFLYGLRHSKIKLEEKNLKIAFKIVKSNRSIDMTDWMAWTKSAKIGETLNDFSSITT